MTCVNAKRGGATYGDETFSRLTLEANRGMHHSEDVHARTAELTLPQKIVSLKTRESGMVLLYRTGKRCHEDERVCGGENRVCAQISRAGHEGQ